MKPRPLACALVLVFAGLAAGQAPPPPNPPPMPPGLGPVASVVVTPPGPVRPGTVVTIDARASIGDTLDWDTDVPESSFAEDTGGRLVYFFARDPGSFPFKVQAFGIVDGKIRFSKVKVVLVVEAPVPPAPIPTPEPPPGPDPTPPPDKPTPPIVAPVVGRMFATLVYSFADTSTAPIRQGGLGATLEQVDCKWSAYPESTVKMMPDGTPSTQTLVQENRLQPYIDKAGGLPVVVVQDSTGKVIDAFKPADAASVAARVKTLRGGGR